MKKLFSRVILITLPACLFYISSFAGTDELNPVERPKGPATSIPSNDHYLQGFNTKQAIGLCMENCKRRTQMASMGIEAITEICQHQCNIEKARTMSRSDEPDVKEEGTRLLCEIADRTIVPDLIALLEEDMVKRTGIWAEIIPALGRAQDDRAVPILIEMATLPDDDWLGREMAVLALGELGRHSATKALIKAAWSTETRGAAITALAELKDPHAAATLVSAIQPNEEQLIREIATNGLVQLNSDAVMEIYDEFMNYSPENKQTRKRVWLCEILGKINDEKSKDILQKSYNDTDLEVRECAQKYD